MNKDIIFTKSETIKVTVYKNSKYDCPLFKIESDNKNSNVSEIIEDTLKLY